MPKKKRLQHSQKNNADNIIEQAIPQNPDQLCQAPQAEPLLLPLPEGERAKTEKLSSELEKNLQKLLQEKQPSKQPALTDWRALKKGLLALVSLTAVALLIVIALEQRTQSHHLHERQAQFQQVEQEVQNLYKQIGLLNQDINEKQAKITHLTQQLEQFSQDFKKLGPLVLSPATQDAAADTHIGPAASADEVADSSQALEDRSLVANAPGSPAATAASPSPSSTDDMRSTETAKLPQKDVASLEDKPTSEQSETRAAQLDTQPPEPTSITTQGTAATSGATDPAIQYLKQALHHNQPYDIALAQYMHYHGETAFAILLKPHAATGIPTISDLQQKFLQLAAQISVATPVELESDNIFWRTVKKFIKLKERPSPEKLEDAAILREIAQGLPLGDLDKLDKFWHRLSQPTQSLSQNLVEAVKLRLQVNQLLYLS